MHYLMSKSQDICWYLGIFCGTFFTSICDHHELYIRTTTNQTQPSLFSNEGEVLLMLFFMNTLLVFAIITIYTWLMQRLHHHNDHDDDHDAPLPKKEQPASSVWVVGLVQENQNNNIICRISNLKDDHENDKKKTNIMTGTLSCRNTPTWYVVLMVTEEGEHYYYYAW